MLTVVSGNVLNNSVVMIGNDGESPQIKPLKTYFRTKSLDCCIYMMLMIDDV